MSKSYFNNIEQKAEQASKEGFNIEISNILTESWGVFKQNAIGFIGFTLLMILLQILPDLYKSDNLIIGVAKSIFSLLLIPLYLGYAIVTFKIINNEEYSFADFFGAYSKLFPLIILSIIYVILVSIGTILLIIPGIYIAVVLSFSTFVLYFANKGISDSFKISRKFIHNNFWEYFIFIILMGIIAVIGVVALGVGLFVSIPVASIALALYFYKGLASENEDVENHLI